MNIQEFKQIVRDTKNISDEQIDKDIDIFAYEFLEELNDSHQSDVDNWNDNERDEDEDEQEGDLFVDYDLELEDEGITFVSENWSIESDELRLWEDVLESLYGIKVITE